MRQNTRYNGKAIRKTRTGVKQVGFEQKMVSQMRGGLKVKVYLDRAKLFALYAS